MKRIFLLCSVLVLALFALGMGGKGAEDVQDKVVLTKITLRDNALVYNERPLVVSFAEDMVKESQLGKAVQKNAMPFHIFPEVAGEGQWISPNTFVFTPSHGYPHGKAFHIVLDENLKALSGKPARYYFAFQTQPNFVEKIWVQEYNQDAGTALVSVLFRQSVYPNDVTERIEIIKEDSGEKVKFSHIDAEKNSLGTVHTLLMENVSEANVALKILADKGNNIQSVGLDKDFISRFSFVGAQSTGSVVLEEDQSNSRALSNMRLDEPYIYSDSQGNLRAQFYFSEGMASHNQEEFIEISPKLPYTINYSGITISEGLEPQTRLEVSLLPGFIDRNGSVLDQKLTRSVVIPDRSAMISFNDTGNYLTPVHGGQVALTLCNVSEVQVTLFRHYDNNLPLLSYLDDEDTTRTREVFSKRFDVDLQRNELVERGLDLLSLAEGKPGVYTLQVVGYTPRNSGSWVYQEVAAFSSRTVVLSDLGITVKNFPDGITAFVAAISSGKPVADANISVFSASNQLIAKGKTNSEGVLVHQRPEAWDWQLQPAVVVAQKGDDISLLPLTYNLGVDLVDYGTSNYLTDGYEAFVFTPRGIFRPAETVDLKVFVRDRVHATPVPFPVVMKVVSTNGVEMFRQSVTLSEQGGAEARFSLPASAPMGTYTATVFIPGQDNNPLGRANFLVENFVPPRLEVGLELESEIFRPEQDNTVSLQADYLFGTPGSGLNFQLGYSAGTVPFKPKGFDDYVFGSSEHGLATESNMSFLTDVLAEDGSAYLNFAAPEAWSKVHGRIQLRFFGGVQEHSGRWVQQSAVTSYFPQEFLLGLKIAPKDPKVEGLALGKDVAVNIVALTPEEEQVNPGAMLAEVYFVERVWNTVLRNGRYVYDSTERLLLQESVNLVEDGNEKTFVFKPKKQGSYRLRCVTKDGRGIAVRDFSVWGQAGEMDEQGVGRMDMVEVTVDREGYQAGQTAKVSIKSPFTGTLFFGVEHQKQLSTKVIDLTSPSVVMEVPVSAEMLPNATVTAWVVRGVDKNSKGWFPHRAYGSASIKFDQKPYTLEVKAHTPEKVEPSAALDFDIEIKDSAGSPVQGEFAVAFVDEGVLSLTNFKTPDPLKFFFAQRYIVSKSFDIYNLLLRPAQKLVSLLKAGGDGLGQYFGSLSTQPIFLAAFEPSVLTDAEGKGRVHFDIPEYSGKGRLMIVGAANNRFASAESFVSVGRDIVLELAAPVVVAPQDSFDISLKLFNLVDNLEGDVTVTASSTGSLVIEGDKEYTFSMKGKKEHVIIMQAKALQGNAVSTLDFTVKVAGREDLSFTKSTEVVVRSPYPRSSDVQAALVLAGETEVMESALRWERDLSQVSLSIGQNPVLAVLPALKFLIDYPHRCAEQEVSRTWPYLHLAEMMRQVGMDMPEAEDYDKTRMAEAVRHIASLQNGDGGFSMWSGGYTSSPWVSINATLFLLEVKDKVNVPKPLLDSAITYTRSTLFLEERFFGSELLANSTKAYAAFVLTRAGQAPLSWLQVLSMREDRMLPSGRIFLAGAKALHTGSSKPLAELMSKDKMEISWNTIRYNDSFESPLRNTALLLYTWTLVDPANKQTKELSLALAKLLAKNPYMTTQEAGFASLALGHFLVTLPKPEQAINFTVFDAGKLTEKTLKNKEDLQKWQAKNMLVEEAIVGREPLFIEHEFLNINEEGKAPRLGIHASDGDVFASYVVRGVPLDAPPVTSSSVVVNKRWLDANGNEINLGEAVLNRGDKVTVEISVSPSVLLEHFVIVDMLPGGMEIEQARLSLTSEGNDGSYSDDGYWRSPEFLHEAREDRMVILMNNVQSTYVYSYSLRAVNTGNFVLPGISAEGMYAPSVQASQPSGNLAIQEIKN